MKYSRDGDTVTITMRRDEFDSLLIMLGMATGTALHLGDRDLYRFSLRMINEINKGNPDFIPYEIPNYTP